MVRTIKLLWKIIKADPLALSGFFFMVFISVVAIFAPIIAPYDPNEMNYRTEGTAIAYDQNWTIMESITNHTLNGVIYTTAGNAIAVGNEGTILEYTQEWKELIHLTESHLQSVGYAQGTIIAVGDNGVSVIGSAGSWRVVDTGTDIDLFGVSVSSPNHALAVGASGTVLRWDGYGWETLSSGASEDLFSVSLLDDAFGFIVGARNTIFHYDGETLQRQQVMGFRALYSVDIYSQELAIAVGERGTILRYNGRTWSAMYPPETRDLRGIVITDPNNAIAIGTHGVLMRLQGSTWRREDIGYRRNLNGVAHDGPKVMVIGTDPYVNSLAKPTLAHPFGTNHLGRDLFSQIVYGSRTALMVGLLAAFMVTIIGTNVGLVSGYYRGKLDTILMRIVDIMYALPLEPFAMILVLLFRPGLGIIILTVGLLTWRTTARIIRSQVLSLVARPFVKAAKVAGASDFRIMYIHVAPNILPLAFLQLAVAMAFAITAEATLSFLGLGAPGVYSWGTILHQSRSSGAWREAWWWVIPPGVLIMLTVVSVFFISRALEVLTNPRLGRDS